MGNSCIGKFILRYCVLGIGCCALGTGHRVLGIGCRAFGNPLGAVHSLGNLYIGTFILRYRVLGIGCWALGTGHWVLDIGCRAFGNPLGAGHSVLGTGKFIGGDKHTGSAPEDEATSEEKPAGRKRRKEKTTKKEIPTPPANNLPAERDKEEEKDDMEEKQETEEKKDFRGGMPAGSSATRRKRDERRLLDGLLMLLQSTGDEEEEEEESDEEEDSEEEEEEEENPEDSLLARLAQIVQDAQKQGSKGLIQKLKALVEEKIDTAGEKRDAKVGKQKQKERGRSRSRSKSRGRGRNKSRSKSRERSKSKELTWADRLGERGKGKATGKGKNKGGSKGNKTDHDKERSDAEAMKRLQLNKEVHGFGKGSLISFFKLMKSLEEDGSVPEDATTTVVSWEEAYKATTIAKALGISSRLTLIVDPEGKDKGEHRPAWAECLVSAKQVHFEFNKFGVRKVWSIALCEVAGRGDWKVVHKVRPRMENPVKEEETEVVRVQAFRKFVTDETWKKYKRKSEEIIREQHGGNIGEYRSYGWNAVDNALDKDEHFILGYVMVKAGETGPFENISGKMAYSSKN